jgi:hypothetical protein
LRFRPIHTRIFFVFQDSLNPPESQKREMASYFQGGLDEDKVVKALLIAGAVGGFVCLVLVGEGLSTVEKGSIYEEPSCLQEPADW